MQSDHIASDIIIGDVLAWETALSWHGSPEGLGRPLTWAVTIHATVPVLPTLRGGELIIVPPRTLDELNKVERIGWSDIARSLTGQQIAGILVQDDFQGAPVPDVPVFHAPASYLLQAEGHLNRIITEHRAELYRLGSDLTRALSAASLGGADLEALLAVAGDVGRRDMLLVDSGGGVLARSRSAPQLARLIPGTPGAAGWQFQETSLPGGEGVSLAVRSADNDPPEATRLALSQTLMAIESFLGTNGLRKATTAPPSREMLLADVLLGQVPASQLVSRCQILSIDPREPLRVALCRGSRAGFDGPIRTTLRRDIRGQVTMLAPDEMAVLVPESRWDEWWPHLQAAARQVSDVTLVASEVQPDVTRAQVATSQARAFARVRENGNDARSALYDVLLPVWDPAAFNPSPARLVDFADRMLEVLESHDRERGGDLVQTLGGYLAAGGSATGAAEQLGIHRNTLGYRLKRIADLTGLDLDDEDVRLAMGLALRIRRLQQVLG